MVPIHHRTKPIPDIINKYIEWQIIIRAIPKAASAIPEKNAMGQVIAKHSFDMFRKNE